MRAVVQRVTSSSVSVNESVIGAIGIGFNILVGISKDDTLEDLKYIKDKIINLIVFHDENNKMNFSLLDIKGEILVISQFTLYGDCRKGRRPNFMEAQSGIDANRLYEEFIDLLKTSNLKVECGEFGADMKVKINNDGPVTILLDSKKSF